ncbi:hypothetical protein [Nocardia sp. AG03]|uniref:hypothetical protein n=1 Tax=Nocardia sp. AG03 TaxID=3025312 RepID=UPI002418AAB7|nr:hypothetical protein [Nocardia sp. AG03]
MTRPVAVGIALLAATVGCGGGEAGTELSAAPTGVRWEGYQGVSLPHADQGPASVTDGAATGFEHSPRGAGLAALTHTLRLGVAPDTQWATVVNRELMPGPARDEWAINRVRLSITGPAAPGYAPRLLGYKITEYRDEQSSVEVYTEYADRSRVVSHTTVGWYGGDWRLRLPDPLAGTRPVDVIDELPPDIVRLEAPR